jgi:FkbM family methyltransferase
MKAGVRWALRKVGYDIVRHAETPVQPFEVLPLVVNSRIAAGQSVRFVQIGANDGVSGDPIRELVLQHRLPGIFVEPLPDLFARLKQNYAELPDAIFEQCAVGEHDGEATIYRVRPDPGLPEWLQELASFDRSHLSSKKFDFKGIESYVEPLTVPVLTVTSLLQKHNYDGCDLLQVDTEGFDCRIVQWTLRAGLRPAIINYEHHHADPAERARCKHQLAECGYAFLDVGRDTLAVRQD